MGLSAKLLAGLLALILAAGLGWRQGVKSKQAEWNAAELERKDAAEETRQFNQRAATKLRDQRDEEVRSINARLADALERLRKRPERRLPDPAAASCDGASGAELSGEDASFLARFAAERDEQAAALKECYAWIDIVTRARDSADK